MVHEPDQRGGPAYCPAGVSWDGGQHGFRWSLLRCPPGGWLRAARLVWVRSLGRGCEVGLREWVQVGGQEGVDGEAGLEGEGSGRVGDEGGGAGSGGVELGPLVLVFVGDVGWVA